MWIHNSRGAHYQIISWSGGSTFQDIIGNDIETINPGYQFPTPGGELVSVYSEIIHPPASLAQPLIIAGSARHAHKSASTATIFRKTETVVNAPE